MKVSFSFNRRETELNWLMSSFLSIIPQLKHRAIAQILTEDFASLLLVSSNSNATPLEVR